MTPTERSLLESLVVKIKALEADVTNLKDSVQATTTPRELLKSVPTAARPKTLCAYNDDGVPVAMSIVSIRHTPQAVYQRQRHIKGT